MNEELITTLATNIIGVTLFSFVGGVLAGWYATFAHYQQIERERKAVSDYIKSKKTETPPPSECDQVRAAMNTLQKHVDNYHVEWRDTTWDYKVDEELKLK